jgi:ComF family protein
VHDGVARDFVHALKYGRRREVAPLLAAALLARPSVGAALAQADVVVPVPADPLRRRRRGFDQAVLLAEELVRLAATDGPRPLALRALRRRPGGPPQASLSGAARRRALPGVMRPARGARRRLAGARVVLVDDVVTTGATFQEATRQLAALGARVVAVVACTRAGAPGRATRAPIRGEAP